MKEGSRVTDLLAKEMPSVKAAANDLGVIDIINSSNENQIGFPDLQYLSDGPQGPHLNQLIPVQDAAIVGVIDQQELNLSSLIPSKVIEDSS